MMLEKVKSGSEIKAPITVIYGAGGLGKSTFACGFEADGSKSAHHMKPLVLDIENSTRSLDVSRLESDAFKSARDIYNVIEELRTTEHDYKTLVIDTADWMESLIFGDVAGDSGKKNIADISYGVGYAEAYNRLKAILSALTRLRDEKNIAITLTAHQKIVHFDDPVNESYDTYTLKLHDGKSTNISALLFEWAECVLFATTEVFIESKEKRFNKAVNKGRGGDRIIFTSGSPSYRAKNRYNLPEQLPLSWDAYINAIKKNSHGKVQSKTGEGEAETGGENSAA